MQRFERFSWGVLAYNLAVIAWRSFKTAFQKILQFIQLRIITNRTFRATTRHHFIGFDAPKPTFVQIIHRFSDMMQGIFSGIAVAHDINQYLTQTCFRFGIVFAKTDATFAFFEFDMQHNTFFPNDLFFACFIALNVVA